MALTATVVVAARDASSHLPALLDALAAQTTPAAQVLVVDDGSRDATARLAREHPVVSDVLSGAGDGPGAARNLGAASAVGDVLAFTDADCRPDPDWLAAGLAAVGAGAHVVQGRVEPPRDAQIGLWDRTIRVTGLSGLFETANLLIERSLFERLGGFEPWLSPAGGKELGEDVWLGWRAVRTGAHVVFAEDAKVEHAVLPRRARGYLAERERLRYFPEIARRIPELRRLLFYRRAFLTRRSAMFDLAVLSVLAGTRHRGALVAGLPYARIVAGDVRRNGVRAGVVRALADGVSLAVLLRGSVVARSVLL